jgi:hypothetical protein
MCGKMNHVAVSVGKSADFMLYCAHGFTRS